MNSIIYVSCAMSESEYSHLFGETKNKPGQAVQKYHRVLAKGFSLNDKTVEMISLRPVSRDNTNNVFFAYKSESDTGKTYDNQTWKINYNYIRTNTLPIVRNFSGIWNIRKEIVRLSRKKGIPQAIICDTLNQTASMGAIWASKRLKCKCIGIVTDMPGSYSGSRIGSKINKSIISGCTDYVFLTEEMNAVLNTKGKPYVVIEGQTDIPEVVDGSSLKKKSDKFICLYSGGLYVRYGIKNLVDGFVQADIPNSELHLYGSGDYVEEIRAIAGENTKVKYHGVVMNNKVLEAQKKAWLLINPRPTNEEFTKYSFPSKNLEYMLSGTPVLTTKLPGMPKEYYPYVFLLDDESKDGICNSLMKLSGISKGEMQEYGERAQQFVITKKNCKAQAKVICDELIDN